MPPKQGQIVALASIVEKIKDNNLKLPKSFKTSPLWKRKSKRQRKRKRKGQGSETGYQTVSVCQGEKILEAQYPKDREANTKKVNNKTYFWCPTHQAWTIHHPEESKINT